MKSLVVVGVVVGLLVLVNGVVAQSAPLRIVQASDGTLYVLKDGARYAIVADAIDDDELAVYEDGGANGAALLLGANAAVGGPVASGPAPVAEVMPNAQEQAQPETPAQPEQPETPARPAAPAQPAPACPGTPPGAKRSAACPSLPPAATPVPAEVRFTGVQGAVPGQNASVSGQAAPGAVCGLTYTAPGALRGASAVLEQQTVGDPRVVTWSFPIPADSPTGTGTVIATCNRATITSPIQIGSGLSR